jgi:hypothetical protein
MSSIGPKIRRRIDPNASGTPQQPDRTHHGLPSVVRGPSQSVIAAIYAAISRCQGPGRKHVIAMSRTQLRPQIL